jgi:hypothetical protein
MKSIVAARVVAIYSIIFGALSVLGNISELADDPSLISSIFLAVALIILGVFSIIKAKQNNYKESLFISLIFVFYCVILFGGLVILLWGDVFFTLGLLVIGLIITPFVFSIIYFVSSSREKALLNNEAVRKQSDSPTLGSDNNNPINSLNMGIEQLKKLKQDGLISEEQFKDYLKKYLDQNIK